MTDSGIELADGNQTVSELRVYEIVSRHAFSGTRDRMAAFFTLADQFTHCSSDYPLPSAYNRAFDASSRLVFEDDPKSSSAGIKALLKAGIYPKGDSLRNHVDPRTYAYLRRFFALLNISEEKFSRFRPWLIDLMPDSPSSEHFELGVEKLLARRAQANSKPVSGLESTLEHNPFFVGLSDREAEALLLILFINAGHQRAGKTDLIQTWRRGDADALSHSVHESFRDFT
jgi:uncharacterized protein YbaP (TraB family)